MAKAEIRKPKPKQNPLKAADVTVITTRTSHSAQVHLRPRQDPRSPRDWRDRSGAAQDRSGY